MGVVHYQKGNKEDPIINGLHCKVKVVSPYSFEPEKGWHMSPKEAHGLQKGEVEKEESAQSEKENVKKTDEEEILKNPDYLEPERDDSSGIEVNRPRGRKQFTCKGCLKRKNRFEDTILLNESGLKFCSEKCKTDYKE